MVLDAHWLEQNENEACWICPLFFVQIQLMLLINKKKYYNSNNQPKMAINN